MKEIKISRVKMTNFCGVESYETSFDAERPEFRGDNGTGKTTLATSFFWVLWGKNLAGMSDTKFQVKPLDGQNKTHRDVITEVEIDLSVDGELISLRRTYKEIWKTTRSEVTEHYAGNETCRYWNDILKKESEFNALVAENICPESIFRQITDPSYFFNQKSADQRNFLIKLAGDVTPEDILEEHPEFEPVISKLSPSVSIDDYSQTIASEIKRVKADADTIPARIDERKRDVPESEDWGELENQINQKKSRINEIDTIITDQTKVINDMVSYRASQRSELSSLNNRLSKRISAIQNEANADYLEQVKKHMQEKTKIEKGKSEILDIEDRLRTADSFIEDLARKRESLLKEREEINSRTIEIDENEFICPTCHRPLDTSDVERKKADLITAFNTQKSKELQDNLQAGLKVKAKRTEAEAKRDLLKSQLADFRRMVAKSEVVMTEPVQPDTTDIENNDIEVITLRKQIDELNAELSKGIQEPDSGMEELKRERRSLSDEVSVLSVRLSKREVIANNQKRIDELSEQFSRSQAEIVRLKGIQNMIIQYKQCFCTKVEDRVNTMFSLVEFKLFEDQINGGVRECCEALINGVPYSTNLNSASRVNAGMDFVGAVQDKYGIYAPVWVDNRETVTNLFHPNGTHTQVISLVKDENYSRLTRTI